MTVQESSHITNVAFEGPDKSGKSTLIQEVNRLSNYRLFCVDRSFASGWVYDRITGRRDRTEQIVKSAKELSRLTDTLFVNVYLRGDREVLAQRIREHDEFSEQRLLHLDQMIALFDEYATQIDPLPHMIIDTSASTIEESAREIIAQISKYEEHNN